jgi:glycerol kinase
VCYQTKDLQKAMEKDGMRPVNLRVDGGMVVNNWFLQFLSDLLGVSVERPRIIETTALGVAYLAGLQAGVYQSLNELSDMWRCDRAFHPTMSKIDRDRLAKLQHETGE